MRYYKIIKIIKIVSRLFLYNTESQSVVDIGECKTGYQNFKLIRCTVLEINTKVDSGCGPTKFENSQRMKQLRGQLFASCLIQTP